MVGDYTKYQTLTPGRERREQRLHDYTQLPRAATAQHHPLLRGKQIPETKPVLQNASLINQKTQNYSTEQIVYVPKQFVATPVAQANSVSRQEFDQLETTFVSQKEFKKLETRLQSMSVQVQGLIGGQKPSPFNPTKLMNADGSKIDEMTDVEIPKFKISKDKGKPKPKKGKSVKSKSVKDSAGKKTGKDKGKKTGKDKGKKTGKSTGKDKGKKTGKDKGKKGKKGSKSAPVKGTKSKAKKLKEGNPYALPIDDEDDGFEVIGTNQNNGTVQFQKLNNEQYEQMKKQRVGAQPQQIVQKQNAQVLDEVYRASGMSGQEFDVTELQLFDGVFKLRNTTWVQNKAAETKQVDYTGLYFDAQYGFELKILYKSGGGKQVNVETRLKLQYLGSFTHDGTFVRGRQLKFTPSLADIAFNTLSLNAPAGVPHQWQTPNVTPAPVPTPVAPLPTMANKSFAQNFATADVNHDGFLDKNEYARFQRLELERTAEKAAAVRVTPAPVPTPVAPLPTMASKSFAQNFATADVNHDGFLDKNEYARFQRLEPERTAVRVENQVINNLPQDGLRGGYGQYGQRHTFTPTHHYAPSPGPIARAPVFEDTNIALRERANTTYVPHRTPAFTQNVFTANDVAQQNFQLADANHDGVLDAQEKAVLYKLHQTDLNAPSHTLDDVKLEGFDSALPSYATAGQFAQY